MSDVLIQRALQMSPHALLAFVKNRGLSRAQLQVVIEDLAAARRAPSHSRKQGYDDFVTKNVVGMELHRIFVTTAPMHLSSAAPRRAGG